MNPKLQQKMMRTEIERHNSKRKADNDELIAPIKRRKSDIFNSDVDDTVPIRKDRCENKISLDKKNY